MKLGELLEIAMPIVPFAKTDATEKWAAVILLNYPPNHTLWSILNDKSHGWLAPHRAAAAIRGLGAMTPRLRSTSPRGGGSRHSIVNQN
jgi:hypothetical protein